MKKLPVYLLLWAMLPLGLLAQQDLNAPIPFDPTVKTGTLPNGMKYFIKQNAKPEKRAELRIALNAGAMQENDDQQGLAHFCEHMCFNGTKNFPKSALVDFLESVGTKFGAHLNAYTSFDETVYMLQIPTDDETLFRKGFTVLEDWASNVSFDNQEIDKERGVVVSERRLGLGADKRMFDKVFPVQMKGSRYASRLPIGQLEVLEKCKYETLKQFYADWYRPDLMAIIAIGDFDVDMVEKIIKTQFGAIPSKANPRKRENYEVPNHREMLVASATDKEASYNRVSVMFKHPVKESKTLADYRNGMIRSLASSIIRERLDDLKQQPKAPFSNAYAYYGGMVRAKNAFNVGMIALDGQAREATQLIFTELARIKKFGFNPDELARAKKSVMKYVSSLYTDRDKTESRDFTYGLVDHYLEGTPFTSIDFDYTFYQNHLEKVNIKEVNEMVQKWITNGENAVVTFTGVEKEGNTFPSKEETLKMFLLSQQADLKPLVAKKEIQSLIAEMPEPSSIVEEKDIPEIGMKEVKLSNGLRLLLKKTDFKNDEILIGAYSFGGSSLYADADDDNAGYAPMIVEQAGVSTFSRSELDRFLTGKDISLRFYISETMEGMYGSHCSPEDLETAMQLIYLYMAQPRFDMESFETFKNEQKGFLANMSRRPDAVFRDSVSRIMGKNHPRRQPTTMETVNNLDPKRALEIYKERFGHISDFTFVFVGNFDEDELKKRACQYLGGIQGDARPEEFKDVGVDYPRGNVTKTIYKGSEPKSQVQLMFKGDAKFSRQNRAELSALTALLNIKLRESLREDKGGVYGVGCSGNLTHYPKEEYTITVSFGCAPERAEELIAAAMEVIEKVKKEGISEKDMTKIKETRRRELELQMKENSFWLNNIMSTDQNKEDFIDFESAERLYEFTARITEADFKRLANQYFDLKNVAKFVLKPETK
ncbi:MAG: M16 family metallopeptidase [Bacteroidia bacterium]